MILFWILLSLLILDLLAICLLSLWVERVKKLIKKQREKERERERQQEKRRIAEMQSCANTKENVPCAVGFLHNQGSRPSQQDNLCVESVFGGQGALAVVADGMGGLSGGDIVSGRIVQDVKSMAPRLTMESMDQILPVMVERIADDVNKMLGPNGIYKSGSTMLSVLTDGRRFSWSTVGDSRIYLYRGGIMNQVNVEHNQLHTEWMPEVQAGRMDMKTALSDPDGKKLTSFIGMGKLRYLSYSRNSIELRPGDRLLLMTDGVFNTLSDAQMAEILANCPDVAQAASLMENKVLAANARGQDNFTAVILGF